MRRTPNHHRRFRSKPVSSEAPVEVVPVVSKVTPEGYLFEVLPAWHNFPTDVVDADTALMYHRLQGYIETMPLEFYWVHRRFKTRTVGEPPIY